MKDKSRLLSSVIVSLLAGFIYYQFGDDIQEKFQNSFKAVLSSNDLEIHVPADCESFNSLVAKTDIKIKKKKSKFYIKRKIKNTIEFKTNDVTIPDEELLSDFISKTQAKVQKPYPDRNENFTAQLDHILNNKAPESNQTPNVNFQLSYNANNSDPEIADNGNSKPGLITNFKNFDKVFDKIKKSRLLKQKTDDVGNGFEYNYTTDGNLETPESDNTKEESETKKMECEQTKVNCEKIKNDCKRFKIECKTNLKNGNKVVVPEINEKVEDLDTDIDAPKIEMEEDESDDDSM